MNLAATLLAQPIQPGVPGLVGAGERGGGRQRTKSTDAAFLRDLRAELARPVGGDRRANPGAPAERAPGARSRGPTAESAPTREAGWPDASPPSPGARADDPVDAPGSPTDLHTDTHSAGRTDAQAEGVASPPTDAAATEGPDAPSDARAGGPPDDPGAREPAGQASIAERSRAEQAQAARAIPADRPLTVAELNKALASADVASWPESLRRQLGLDRPAATTTPGPRSATPAFAQPTGTPAPEIEGDPTSEPSHSPSGLASLDQRHAEPSGGVTPARSWGMATEYAPVAKDSPVADARAHAAHRPRGTSARAESIGPGPGAPGFVPASQSTPRDAGARKEASAFTPTVTAGRLFNLARSDTALPARGPAQTGQGSTARHEEAMASQLARGVAAAAEAKDGSVRLHLRPQALGAMTVSVQRGGDAGRVEGGVSVAFAVDNPETAAMLERSLGDLSAALEERGILVREASIEVRDARSNLAALTPTPHADAQPEATPAEPPPAHDQRQTFDPHQPGREQGSEHGHAGRDRPDTHRRDAAPWGHDAVAEATDEHHDGPAPAHAVGDARTNLTLRLDAIG